MFHDILMLVSYFEAPFSFVRALIKAKEVQAAGPTLINTIYAAYAIDRERSPDLVARKMSVLLCRGP